MAGIAGRAQAAPNLRVAGARSPGDGAAQRRCGYCAALVASVTLVALAICACAGAGQAQAAATVASLSAGWQHTCAVLSTGYVQCWGRNDNGQLGNGSTVNAPTPVEVKSIQTATQAAAGAAHTCVLLASGHVQCWGQNFNGQLGNGTTTSSTTPVEVQGISTATQVSSGGYHSCALLSGGHVVCWGFNEYGQLGNGTTTSADTPVEVQGITAATAVTAGADHSCALLSAGHVDCWGYNAYGQLGNATTTNSSKPVEVHVITTATRVAAGAWHTCAVLSTGHVDCWGENFYGELGNATKTNSTKPVEVHSVTTATRVSAGNIDTCAVLSSGHLECWGDNETGELGNGTTTGSTTPVEVQAVTTGAQIAAGSGHTCALLSNNHVECWGWNHYGQLGNGTTTSTDTPTEVQAIATATRPAAGVSHSCALLSTGHVQCWGENQFGQLGNGGLPTGSDTPVAVTSLTTATQLASGSYHACARLSTGHVDCWGENAYGGLGNGTTTNASKPVEVSGISTATQVSAGWYHTCAVLSTGHVDCWGYNGYGELGNGTTTNASKPVEVQGISTATQVAAGIYFTCALLASGHVDCWGDNSSGQLGNGTTTGSSKPVEVQALSTASQLSDGGYHACAVLSTGHVECWGYNGYGQLGAGYENFGNALTPVEVQGITTAAEVSGGLFHTCALLTTGHLDCWGYGEYGQLGTGASTFATWVPLEVHAISTAIHVSAGGYHTCAVLSGGHVECWGNNSNGQLGNGGAWTTLPSEVLAFTQVPPTVTTGAASSVTQTAATVNASVNPNGGEVSECKLEYGTSPSYASSVACSSLPGSGTSPVAVSAMIGGLTANTTYHFRIVATNAGGTSTGEDKTFKTLPNAPTVTTGAASSVTQTAATVNASVNPNGGEVSECKLEYGTSLPSGSSVPCSPSPGSGSSPVSVSGAVSGLTANTTYQFRVIAVNAGGTSTGSAHIFTTLSNGPSVVTGSASSVAQTTATLEATVNPNGGNVTECKLEYGTSLPSGSSVPCSPSPGSGSSPVSVSGAVSGLTANTTYQFRLVAVNAGGTSTGSTHSFTTLPNGPTVATGGASSVTQTNATLEASVNPNGRNVTECKLEYGTSLPSGSSVPCSPTPGSGSTPVTVSGAVGSLTANTTYQYRVIATNAGGTGTGATHTFSTLPNAPTVVTEGASSVTQTSATLKASVNPNGREVTNCTIEYGATESYGSAVPCASPPGSGTSPVQVTGTASGLTPNASYHYRIVAGNAVVTSYGGDRTFMTLPNSLASGCTDSWTNTSGGSWFDAANWSTGKVPTATDEVCITKAGEYTVTMPQTTTVTVKAMTIGESAGSQKLSLESTCGYGNAELDTTEGLSVTSSGVLALTSTGCGYSVTLGGPITNAGTITAEPGSGGGRYITGNVTNTGTVGVADGVVLTVAGGAVLTNGSGGTVAGAGSGGVGVLAEGTFNEGAGTTSGTDPVVIEGGALVYSGSGKSEIVARGEASTLSGNLAAGESLSIEGSCAVGGAKVTAAASFTNGGSIALTSGAGGGCGYSSTLAVSSGTLTNTGTVTAEPDTYNGPRNITGNFTNTGTVNMAEGVSLTVSGGAVLNTGMVNVSERVSLTVAGGAVLTNGSGGTIASAGSGGVHVVAGGTFTEGGGTTSGTYPVVVEGGALVYSGSGKSQIVARGEQSTLSGNLAAGQSLSIEGSCAVGSAKVTAAASFTNGGSIALTSGGGGCGYSSTLAVSSGTLTNTGTITAEPDIYNSPRNITGSVTNTGTVNVAEGVSLTVAGGAVLTNGSGGTIASAGSGGVRVLAGGTFTESGGTTSGADPVVIEGGALVYSGSGESQIVARGEQSTLSGNLAAGESLSIEGSCAVGSAKVTAAASFTNGGSIALTSGTGGGCGYSSTLAVSSGTLTNAGTITAEPDIYNGPRYITGNVTNTGMVNVAEGVSLTVAGGAVLTNGSGGTVASAGSGGVHVVAGGTFTEGGGTTSGTYPVVVEGGALVYSGSGKSQIVARGEQSTLSGDLAAGQSLSIEGSCAVGSAKVTAAANFTNGGSIALTSGAGGGCGYSSTLAVSSGTLTNAGTITAEPDIYNGPRNITGNITNTGTVSVPDGVALTVMGGAVLNGSGGTIVSAGSGGVHVLAETTFTEGAGTTSGTYPVVVEGGALVYGGSGKSQIVARGEQSTLSGDLAAGQSLSIEGSCAVGGAKVTAAASFTSGGSITLGSGSSCGYSSTLAVSSGTLTNTGTITAEPDIYNGPRNITGNITNTGTVSVGTGTSLAVTGTYTQNAGGTFHTAIGGTSSFGSLSVSGRVALAGTLEVAQVNSFEGEKGQQYPVLTGSSRSGTFESEQGGQISSNLYYKPIYSATDVTLEPAEGTGQQPNAPTAVTGTASSITQTAATLNATVNPNGASVSSCTLEYGTTASYGKSASCTPSPGSGSSPVSVSAAVTGLTGNTTYHFRVAATNAGGASHGSDEAFMTATVETPPSAPTVVTGGTSSVTHTGATLEASVNPNGGEVSDCHFEYGTSVSYGASIPCSSLPGAGESPVAVSAAVSGLVEDVTYHYRISATNAGGVAHGGDETFAAIRPGAPEFGRCVKVPAEKEGTQTVYHGWFTAATCLVKSATKVSKYEWVPGVVKTGFKTAIKPTTTATLETVKKAKVTCTGETSAGTITSPKTVGNVTIRFTGCESATKKCTTSGRGEGELETKQLEGVLGIERVTVKEGKETRYVALDVYPPGKTGSFMEYTCTGGTPVTLSGSIIGPVPADKIFTTGTVKYVETAGKQKPERFEGGEKNVLTNGLSEQVGLKVTGTQTNEEPFEINAFF
jgi:alpha-tubulin suppressor-like RCC1 family protein